MASRLLAAELRRRTERRLSALRFVIFVAVLALAWPVLFSGSISWWAPAALVAIFVGVAVVHEGVVRRRTHDERAAEYYRRGIARMEDRWTGEGNAGEEHRDPEHPYASDLDLFGRGSLFELLCTARTRTGERTLARWLLEPAQPAEVLRRQQAVAELRPRLDLREALATRGEDLREGIHAAPLGAWGAQPPLLGGVIPALAAALLAAANLVTLVAWLAPVSDPILRGLPPPENMYAGSLPFWISLVASVLLAALYHRRAQQVLSDVGRPQHELRLLSALLACVEQERFDCPLLVELRRNLDHGGGRPSRQIARLARLVELDNSRDNLIFRPFAALALVGTQLAFAVERWRAVSGSAVARWLEAMGTLEALAALAGYSYEHPTDPFPSIVSGSPRVEGTKLGHPLLPAERNVRNDVALGELRLLIVSGSNMSGKSTYLRTIGVNVVLALAGAPVRAEALELTPLAVGACMRVSDSLQQGLSHFYAEIKRLRQLVELGRGGAPLLFLLDEVLHGTNSHDRRIGAAALLQGLVESGAVGLVTTHDLALSRIADDLGERAANVHFADHLEGERIVFDYTLRPGVVRKSNALDLMRAVGLDV
jgi:hypothetical protein